LEKIEFRKQGKTNRQVGDEEIQLTPFQANMVEHAEASCKLAYNELIEAGVAKECARMVLPLSTQTTMYMSGSIRSWIHYLDIRCKQDTQKEHRQIALDIQKIFIKNFPNISSVLNWAS
jgi:thymidylate synthase (FAD)